MIYQSNNLVVKERENGIAELQFCADASVNTLNLALVNSLKEAVDAIEQQSHLKGLILCSDKSHFIVGANITEFIGLFEADLNDLNQWLIETNAIFNKIESLPFPTVSVIQSYALGGGCECALSTDFRIGDSTTQIGLPEVKLGIMPGWGGTVRLPRLIGADSAMEIITQGKSCGAAEALKIGLIDAIVDGEALLSSAHKLLIDAHSGQLDWQNRRAQKLAPLTLSEMEAAMSFNVAKGMVAFKAGPNYPAPLTSVKSIEQSCHLDRDQALDVERGFFTKLAKSPQARSLVTVFLNDQYIKGLSKSSSEKVASPCKQAAVIGAGIMGGGIAFQSALKGVPVLMKDIAEPALKLGMKEASNLLEKRRERGKISPIKMAQTLASITPSLSYGNTEHIDIIVEAVVENPSIKSSVLAEVESLVRDDAIITSNTSTIPINTLAKALSNPSRFCGMHFFNPVPKMPLVEIIRGEKTSDDTINKVVSYAKVMSKSPIVVNDCPGFFVNRVLFPYFEGFNLLMRDGASWAQIDNIMEKQFGWPMGPAFLLDVVGIDTAHHAQEVMAAGYPDRMQKQSRDVLDVLFELGLYGQKTGQGFYTHQTDKKGKKIKTVNNELIEPFSAICQPSAEFSAEDTINRMMIPMINEVILCLDEKIIASAQEADIALVYGLGFPPFRGGILRYVEDLGLKNYVNTAQQYAHLGPLYQVPEKLKTMIANGESFYSQTAKQHI